MIPEMDYRMVDNRGGAPYVYQEFPRMLHGANGATLVVENTIQKEAALAAGWALLPVTSAPAESPAIVLTDAPEVDLLALPKDARDVPPETDDPSLVPPEAAGKRGPGRPPKAK